MTAARAVPAGGQEVCTDGIWTVVTLGVVPGARIALPELVLLPIIDAVPIELQAASRNRRQPPRSANE